jgi:hypothetical protein
VWTSTLRQTGTIIDLEVVALSSLWHPSASNFNVFFSVADPDPNPDLYVFGPPGSGYGFGSFYHQAKIVRKTLIPTVL